MVETGENESQETRETPARWWRPRPESILLTLGLGWTVAAKGLVVRRQNPDGFLSMWAEAVLPDVVFFAILIGLLSIACALSRSRMLARLNLVIALVVLGWSMLNAGWLAATSVQLQPGVLGVLLRDPAAFWPIVQNHLVHKPLLAVPIVFTILVGAVWCVYRFVRPFPVAFRGFWPRSIAAGVIALAGMLGVVSVQRAGMRTYSGQVIGFSSHWHALTDLADRAGRDAPHDERPRPRRGQRDIGLPADDAPRPNVVLVFLESVSYAATSLDPDRPPSREATTPYLESIARDGAEFTLTRVPVAQTNKAFWTGFTGTLPDLGDDYVESVLVDEPYESLATILGRAGYRSAFFEMSDGAFGCAPGLFANLGFDWAWFFENLEDESARVGYLGGDDFRMLDPAFAWVDEGNDEPFLLAMITTVSHDPYDLPPRYDLPPTDDKLERYHRSVRVNDDFLRALDEHLAARGLVDNTILCVMGDHGDGFRPESPTGRWAPFEEVIRVPWVMRWPDGLPAATRVEAPISQLDLTPTVLSLAGFDLTRAEFEGLDALDDPPSNRPMYFNSWYENSPIGVVEGARKRVYWPYTDTLFEYDLNADPGEQSPVTVDGDERDEVIRQLLGWNRASRIEMAPRRFREAVTYGHWRTFCSGRAAWAYYVSDLDETRSE